MSSPSDSVERCEGIVQRLLPERGYGFIRARTGAYTGIDFFFHATGLTGCAIRDLEQGDLVRFVPRIVAKGHRAEEIELV